MIPDIVNNMYLFVPNEKASFSLFTRGTVSQVTVKITSDLPAVNSTTVKSNVIGLNN
mgnify:CR=1 FL=1